MSEQDDARRAPAHYVATTRAYCFDLAAMANLMSGTHPFKRNSVVPYRAIFDFIDANASGSALVISTDPVVPWIMRFAGENRCAGYFLDARRCLASGRRYDSIFVISGHHDRSTDLELTAQFNALVAAATGGRNKLASVPIGRDDDAALKSRLTGVPLEQNILTLDYYR